MIIISLILLLQPFRFWEMFAYLANTLIFVLVGVIIMQYIDLFTVADFGYLMVLYIGVIAIR